MEKGSEPPEAEPLEVETEPGRIEVNGSDDISTEDGNNTNAENSGSDAAATDSYGSSEDDVIYDPSEIMAQRYSPKDVVSEITIIFEVKASDKNDKLAAKVYTHFEEEYPGLERSNTSLDYKLWTDQTGTLIARIPFVQESWNFTWEGEYYEPADTGDQSGRLVLVPEFVDGRYEIISIRRIDAIDGDECFEIEGLGAGHAVITFSNEILQKKVNVEVRISEDGSITLLSHREE